MTLRTKSDLDAAFPDDALRGQPNAVTAKKIRDFIDSKFGVGGIAYSNGTTSDIEANWSLFDAFDTAKDTKGLTFDAATGEFIVDAGADGFYLHIAVVSITSPAPGTLKVAFAKNASTAPVLSAIRPDITVVAGEPARVIALDGGFYVAGDRIGLAWDGSGNATITVNDSQMLAVRI